MNRRADLQEPLRVAVVACEASGDVLGAGLIEALRARVPAVEAFGMAGKRMIAAGCEPWHRTEEVSVMGLTEVLPHLPRLLRLRRKLSERIIAARPDVFIGIDSPDFNLPVAAAVKRHGLPAVQYVSPQVWAWRQSRVRGIRAATDLVLCVLPFEADFYAENGVEARFVGHPLADAIPMHADSAAARAALGCEPGRPLIALLPGSRRSEVSRLGKPFFATARWLQERRADLRFIVALANEEAAEVFARETREIELESPALLIEGKALEVMTAADVVLTASGTATLEALLLKRPMVVAHRISPLTYWLVRRLGVAKLPNFSLPNLLSGRSVVPEFVQSEVRPGVLGPAVLDVLDGRRLHADWYDLFTLIHKTLRCDASKTAATEVLDLAARRRRNA